MLTERCFFFFFEPTEPYQQKENGMDLRFREHSNTTLVGMKLLLHSNTIHYW
jgi:hypothetical protein